METRSIDQDGYDACLDQAARYLKMGKVACFPTETFYALGVRYDDERSLRYVIDLKGRHITKSFSLLIGNKEDLWLLVSELDPLSERIIDTLWPAALTVVLKAKKGLPPYIRDERDTIAVRMPAKSFALDLSRRLSIPVTGTSANISGSSPAKSAEEVMAYFPGGIDLLVDGGVSHAILPSTIIEAHTGKIRILREGAVEASEIYSVIEGVEDPKDFPNKPSLD